MGSQPGKEWRQFHLSIAKGELGLAMRVAKAFDMPLSLSNALDLTILAARKQDHVFDPMAVRWIMKAHEQGKLKLHEVEWLARTFRNLWGGDEGSADELTRFLATGKRL